ncbi:MULTISPECIES: NADPH-dependent FMN reductase [Paenibacillus]|uniref:NADPH-dependent FMN reductase n=1 Tax=Paenibacillus lignilyticus TaxID=1172615 RepID=A0ABS5CMJ6_9BACL|nr:MULTISPECIES: NADPH-dependent FMN reductase [Paenibacillus]MBP3967088.1 NADPH-dependent FMN reductase [Paenibacillus lignilyticus]SFS98834.1 FMN reductase [Paenibacillus sp. BC26]
MPKVVIISGSPNPISRLNGLTDYAEAKLLGLGWEVSSLHVASLPAEDLVLARWDSSAIKDANKQIADADAVIVASPVYKASFTGVLKTYLDLLPQTGLEGKVVLPLFIGGTIAHLLTIDYALKPVLSALYARHVSAGVYAVDSQIKKTDAGGLQLDEELIQRLDGAVSSFAEATELFASLRTPSQP